MVPPVFPSQGIVISQILKGIIVVVVGWLIPFSSTIYYEILAWPATIDITNQQLRICGLRTLTSLKVILQIPTFHSAKIYFLLANLSGDMYNQSSEFR